MTSSLRTRANAGIRRSAPGRHRGIILVVTLLVLVALALASVALLRSTDATTTVSGNLMLRQSAAWAVDRGIEQTIRTLWEVVPTPDRTQHIPGQNYYACVRGSDGGCLGAGKAVPKIPDLLRNSGGCSESGLAGGLVANDAAGNKTCFVIERMCVATGPAVGSNCNLSTAAFGADPGTIHYTGLVRPGDAFYRVTVRVEGPRSSVAYAQAMLR
jgi:type IV pilus assembly protein PilX